tara:strand:- start:2438 stop:2614 length:177 start_codon:yes stop_codon:yes gene_type:complete
MLKSVMMQSAAQLEQFQNLGNRTGGICVLKTMSPQYRCGGVPDDVHIVDHENELICVR